MRFYYDPLAELNNLFDDAFTSRVYLIPSTCRASSDSDVTKALDSFRPRMDIHESKDSNTMTATFELPGLKSEDVAIEVHQNRLTVSGELATAPSNEEGRYALRERHHGNFYRILQLPFGTKPEDVKAKMQNGLLTVTFPKTTPEQQAKRIAVQ